MFFSWLISTTERAQIGLFEPCTWWGSTCASELPGPDTFWITFKWLKFVELGPCLLLSDFRAQKLGPTKLEIAWSIVAALRKSPIFLSFSDRHWCTWGQGKDQEELVGYPKALSLRAQAQRNNQHSTSTSPLRDRPSWVFSVLVKELTQALAAVSNM
jgi:hypothetical protein